MDSSSFDCRTPPASVSMSHFPGPSGVDEYHLIIRPTEHDSIDAQLQWVYGAYRAALASLGLDIQTALVRRFFCSDLPSQATALEACPFASANNGTGPCAASWVCQPPLPPAEVALHAYHVSDPGTKLDKSLEDTSLTLNRDRLSHHWTTGITGVAGTTSYDQTWRVFEEYDALLQARGLSLADNVIRTWLFVENIDANYNGMVVARREFFAQRGLTPDTHFIASTGIGGSSTNADAKVTMDAYAISGVRPEQIAHPEAPDYLGPPHAYGVTFERATSIAYRDRKHVIISGTASIDPEGNILYPGNVSRQLDRTIENIEALLKHAGAALSDMCFLIAYVRDPNDQAVAWQQMRERFGDLPFEILVAPVCRPGWLIEIEGNAIVPASNPGLPAF